MTEEDEFLKFSKDARRIYEEECAISGSTESVERMYSRNYLLRFFEYMSPYNGKRRHTESVRENAEARHKQKKRKQADDMNAKRKERAEEEGGQSDVGIKRNNEIYKLYLDYDEPRNKTEIAKDIEDLHDDNTILADAAIDLGRPIGFSGIVKIITSFQKIDKRG